MDPINCECGATYAPKDKSEVRRHEATAKHAKGVASRDDDDGWDLGEPILSWDDLDSTDAAKSFTPDERVRIASSLASTKSAHDVAVLPKHVAEAYVAAVAEDPKVNDAILDDLQAYAKGVVEIIRSEDANVEEEPIAPRPKTKREKAKSEPKVQRVDPAKPKDLSVQKGKNVVFAAGETKVCRTCKIDKPLEEFRRKSSRPDGRDTNCADCSKAWLVANRAKKEATK